MNELFDAAAAANAWKRISAKYSRRYKKEFTAWERLSYYLRHQYSRTYDGGILRVIAFFGESFPEYISDNQVVFQAGPSSWVISSDVNSPDPSERYLLIRMAKAFAENEHLHSYIKRYMNAWHSHSERSRITPMFEDLLRLLTDELEDATRKNDRANVASLLEIRGMMNAICCFPYD